MTPRYLFGPVDRTFAEQCLGSERQAGHCVAFGPKPGVDLTVGAFDTWETIAARFPTGWRPDFIALQLAYTHIPHGLWQAPVPLVGLAGDWNLLWHHYCHTLPRCERVLTDRAGLERLAAAGWEHARYFNLYGCRADEIDRPTQEITRDIDILFVGNMQDAVQRERSPWLARLAALGRRWNVVIRTATYGDSYRRLLARSRIVFNRSIRGECNMRAFEAAGAGALLFQEADNREVHEFFENRKEYVAYRDADLEVLLEFYLTHEDERRAIAEAGRLKAPGYRYGELWGQVIPEIERDLPVLRERIARRHRPTPHRELLGRVWQVLCTATPADTNLIRDLGTALAQAPTDAHLHGSLGLVAGIAAGGDRKGAAAAVDHLTAAVQHAPTDVMAALNRAEALATLEQVPDAAIECRRALDLLENRPVLSPATLSTPHFPTRFDFFRVEWEQAAWANAGDRFGEESAKRNVLAWRLHGLLARLTGSLSHRYEAALARPDLPSTRGALASALVKDGQLVEAVSHLRRAVASNPFDQGAPRVLFTVLVQLGRIEERDQLIHSRRLLARAAPQVVPVEAWFAPAPPALAPHSPEPGNDRPALASGLASVVILCCNELPYTRLCLESLLRHSRLPYELILVDNASTDGTPAYLAELTTRTGPERVIVIRNETNLGFTRGCNQGITRASGRYVVLLNNDTVLTEGWLASLIEGLERSGPKAGMIGPVSNATAAPQQISVDYTEVSGVADFAARLRREHGGHTQATDRLAGFCLVIRRELLDVIGTLDERYGLGFFDDFDLCVRAREAGFELLLAPGVYVHHFLSRTFAGQGIDVAAQFQTNFELFVQKWGRERVESYLPDMRDRLSPSPGERTPSDSKIPASPRNRQRISLCMIVRNEEAALPACLAGAGDLVDEIVVVDTGSTDRTKAIATRYGAKVFDFPWIDSFAAARNESLRHATGDWIFWLDADDRLEATAREGLRRLFAGLGPEPAAYLMSTAMKHGTNASFVDHVRLFRNDPSVRWDYRVHEQILPAAQRAGWPVRRTGVVVRHEGYVDPVGLPAKAERNLRLLNLEYAERPDDPLVLFNLGSLSLERGRADEAIPFLERSIERAPRGYSLLCKSYTFLACSYRQLGRTADALRTCRAGRSKLPREPELLFYEGLLLQEAGQSAAAEVCLRELLQLPAPSDLAGNDVGLQGYKARHNLAIALREQNRWPEAEKEWHRVLTERPDFAPAWLGLTSLLATQGRWDDLEQEAVRAEANPPTREMAILVRAKMLLDRKEPGAAVPLLQATRDRLPQAVWPRLLLAEARWQEGGDPAATEEALRDVLALDPNHLPTRKRLTQLAEGVSSSVPKLGNTENHGSGRAGP